MSVDIQHDHNQCYLEEPARIGSLLQELCKRQVALSLHLDNSELYSTSSVVAVDLQRQQLQLDASAAQAVNACLSRGQPVHVHAQLDKVDVRFVLPRLDASGLTGDKLFTAGFPTRLLYLQRRELYRLSTPLMRWPECELWLDGDSAASVRLRVADIGPGGMALVHELPPHQLRPGQGLQPCRLHIPDGPMLDMDIRICNERNIISSSDGRALRRTGVAFENLVPSLQNHLSRYIFALDRMRNARRQGMD